MNAPDNCPMCGESNGWKMIDSSKKGFNAKNAVIGGILLGGVGLAAGFSGKQKTVYRCTKCGFTYEYDGDVAEKDRMVNFPPKGYKNSGLNTVYLDIINKATPICIFCGQPQNLYVKRDGYAYRFLCSHCYSEFRCEFTFNSKVNGKTMQIMNCGNVNIHNLTVGVCDPRKIILDETKIKF